MRISNLMIIVIILTPLNLLFGQTNDSNFLKNYKAPDFKFRTLTLRLSSWGEGVITKENKVSLNFSTNYKVVENTSKKQGTHNLGINVTLNYSEDKTLDIYGAQHNTRLANRFDKKYFLRNNWFYGIADYSSFSISNYYKHDSITNKYDLGILNINPSFSIGKGRLEPVKYARKAMDIEKMLLKSNLLSIPLTTEQRTELSNEITQIENKRFFDRRLGRIYQLEAIDSLLKKMEVLNSDGVKYFSTITDAYLYSHHIERYSGKQLELGIIEGLQFWSSQDMAKPARHGTFGFLQFSAYLPKSYRIQHNFKSSLAVGYEKTQYSQIIEGYKSIFTTAYSFGYYPSTRTYIDLNIFGGADLTNFEGFAGTKLNIYYYLSPNFRFNMTTSIWSRTLNSVMNNYSNALSNYNFHQEGLNTSQDYSFQLGLSYAIF